VQAIDKIVRFVTNVNKWVAFCVLAIMTAAVAYFCLSRFFGHPVVGDVELVQLGMVLLIVGSLAYTERENAHISVGLIIDQTPKIVQWFFDLVGRILIVAFCVLACWAFIYKMNYNLTSSLLRFPLYPFKIMIIIGFFSWGLEALAKLIKSFFELKRLKVE
jgi:TRAP-type C4-dicarboxylate transport system permease small subunit